MTPADARPRRLFPAAAVLRAGRVGPSAVAAGLGAMAVGGERLTLLAWSLGLAALASFVLALLGWWRFTYRIDADALTIEQGVLRRSHRSIPRERIQDVSIEQDLLRRLFGMVKVRIETGGGDANEASLDSVSRAEAVRLRALLARGRGPGPARPAAEMAAEAPVLVFTMTPARLLLHGLFGFSLVWIAAIFGLLQFVDDALGIEWNALFDTGRAAAARAGGAGIALALAVALLLGFVTGAARNVSRDYNFHLFQARGRFRRVRGLFTRTEVVIAQARIQLAVVRRGPISGRLGWCSVEVQTLGGSDDRGGRQQMAPLASAAEAADVVRACGLPRFDPVGLQPVDRAYIARRAVRTAVPFALGVAGAGLLVPQIWFALALTPLSLVAAVVERRHHRYAFRSTSLQVVRGVLSQREWIVPYGAIQAVTIEAGWLQRRLGTATLSVSTAGARGWSKPAVIDLRAEEAAALARELVARAD